MDKEISLGNEDRSTPLEDYLEKEFDKGWESFVKKIIEENKASNYRLLKVLEGVKDKQYVNDAKAILKTVGGTCRIEIVRSITGMQMKDRRWKSFPTIWVNQKQSSIYGNNKPEGWLYVELDAKRFLSFHYYL